MLQNMSASRFIGAVEAEVTAWEKKLALLSEVLEEWLTCQRNWMYLEPIFTAPDIQKQLPAEHKMFADVDKSWRIIMGKLHQHPNAIKASAQNGLLHTLAKHNIDLEKIQKHLEEYLETKRSAFPRFYFLSDDELLAILSQTTDPQAVQPHLRKLFENISKVNFSEVPKSIEITGMVSGEGETVPFPRSIFSKGATEVWLNQLEDMMRETVKTIIRSSLLEYPIEPRELEESKMQLGLASWTPSHDRKNWLTTHFAQPVLACDQIMWTHGVEESFIRIQAGEKDALAKELEFNKSQIQGMVELIRSDLPHLQRHQVSQAIVLDVHCRDVVDNMVKVGVNSKSDYEWSKQTRYYWQYEPGADSKNVKPTALSILHPKHYEQFTKARTFVKAPASPSKPADSHLIMPHVSTGKQANAHSRRPSASGNFASPPRTAAAPGLHRRLSRSSVGGAPPATAATSKAGKHFAPHGTAALTIVEDTEGEASDGKVVFKRGSGAPANEDCYIKQTNTSFLYRYEYLGNTPRLVITPLTDKAYLTFTSALHLHYGGEASGPAGTGKTETVLNTFNFPILVVTPFGERSV